MKTTKEIQTRIDRLSRKRSQINAQILELKKDRLKVLKAENEASRAAFQRVREEVARRYLLDGMSLSEAGEIIANGYTRPDLAVHDWCASANLEAYKALYRTKIYRYSNGAEEEYKTTPLTETLRLNAQEFYPCQQKP